ncbi:heat shock 70 kDa protein II-like [Culicoides brevitarsis]|uniref:heat shock 70 kDa protein II-like n=1 Tax=Culicoides brevitarsis TaxID=469753 RepID=UPI00307B7A24
MSKPAIGIDLGTTYSVVAVARNGTVEILANDQGNRTTPSCVAFTDTERLVGEGALYQAHNNAENTIYAAKRLIGREFDDPDVLRDMKNWPFAVIEEDDHTKIRVQYKKETKTLYPEEISAAVLDKMRVTAEAALGTKIKDVVITIPAYFNNSQREATKIAADIAGLNVVRMINEPTAAALAYGTQFAGRGRKNVLIFDFGGGTFDVTIVTIKGKDYKVRTITGDTHLGGEDFDTLMVKHFVEEFKRKFGQDISKDKGLLRHLRTQCEQAKRILSSQTQTKVQLAGTKLEGDITRARFEDLCHDLFEKSIKLVEKALKDSEMSKEEVDDVVLVGGSSRIPKIQEMLQDFFNGKELNKSINPDECVAYGAAVQASLLQENQAEQFKGLTLCDVCPLSLGVELINGQMKVYIPRGSTVPAKHFETLQAAKAETKSIVVKIYEGERYMCEENNFLGEVELTNIRSGAEGGGKIDITFEVDKNGLLNVSAVEPITGVSKSISIVNKTRLSKDDTARMIKEATEFRALDEQAKKRVESMDGLERLCCQLKRTAAAMNTRGEMQNADKKKIDDKCDQIVSWLDANRSDVKEAFDRKHAELEAFWNSFLKKDEE